MKESWRLYALPILKEKNYRWSKSWTSIDDIGRLYDGREFTYNDYLKTEQAYVNLLISLFRYLHAQKIKIIQLEVYEDLPPNTIYDKDGKLNEWYNKVKNNMSLSLDNLQYIVPLILRENMWGTFYHKRTRTYIHFGYDYYVYVNSPMFYFCNDNNAYFNIDLERLVSSNGLFIEYNTIRITQKLHGREYNEVLLHDLPDRCAGHA